MGYLVEWHIPKGNFEFDLLNALPSGLRAHVFEIDECEFFLISAYFDSSNYFSQSFDDEHDRLNKLYESLNDAGVEVALNPQVVNLNLWLSNALQEEVISIVSDDDLVDLVVHSNSGSISRLRFRAEDIEVIYENDEIHIFPLITEMNEPVVDLEKFDKGVFTIHAHEKEQTSQLHEIAAEEVESLLGIKPQAIGLATWDFDEERLRRVFTGNENEWEGSQGKPERTAPEGNKSLSLKTRFTIMILVLFAVTAFNGYMEYQKSGYLDPIWYLGVGASIALVLIVFAVLAKRK